MGFVGVAIVEVKTADMDGRKKLCMITAGTTTAMAMANGSRDLTTHLPDECIARIFSFLDTPRDTCSCAAVSKRWLHLLAQMRASDYRSYPPSSTRPIYRCLDWDQANDTTLAAVAVGAYPRGVLTELKVRAYSSVPPPPGITDFGLRIIAHGSPGLKSLFLWNCVQLGNEGLESVAKGCGALEKLNLWNCPLVGDDGLKAIATRCKKLSTLSLESCPLIGNRAVEAFANPLSQLKSVSLVRCRLIGDRGIVSIISVLPQLSTMKLAFMEVGDVVLRAIGQCAKQLRVLCLEKIRGPSEMGYSWIGASKELESLTLRSCVGLTGRRSFNGEKFAGLKRVSIKNCGSLRDEGLIELTKSTQLLKSLILESCSGLTYKGLVQALTNCSKTLKVLSLMKCDIAGHQEHCFPVILERLDTLKLNKCGGIGDWFLSWIGGACGRVKHIAVSGMGGGITDRGLLPLLSSEELESLDLSGCTGITDASVEAVIGASGGTLRSLRLEGCVGLTDRWLGMVGELCPELRDLDLGGCGISDGGVLGLTRGTQPELEVLSLAGCAGITDRSLGFLEAMSGSLEMLSLRGCAGLTQRAIDSASESLFMCDLDV